MTLRASSMVPRRDTKLSQVKLRSLWSLWLQGGPEAADAWPSTLDIELIGSHLVNLCHNLCLGSIFCTQDKLPDTFAPTADERDMRDARRAGALQNSHANECCDIISSFVELFQRLILKLTRLEKGDCRQNKWGKDALFFQQWSLPSLSLQWVSRLLGLPTFFFPTFMSSIHGHRIYISHCGSEALKLLRSALPPVAKGKAEEAGQVVLNLRVSKQKYIEYILIVKIIFTILYDYVYIYWYNIQLYILLCM